MNIRKSGILWLSVIGLLLPAFTWSAETTCRRVRALCGFPHIPSSPPSKGLIDEHASVGAGNQDCLICNVHFLILSKFVFLLALTALRRTKMRRAATGRCNAFDGDGRRDDSHCAQVHDTDDQKDRRQAGTAVATVDAEAQARVARQCRRPQRAAASRLPAAGQVMCLPRGELERAGIRTTTHTAIGGMMLPGNGVLPVPLAFPVRGS